MTLAFNLLYWRRPACADYHKSSLQTVHKDYCGGGPRFIHGVFSDVQPVLIKMAPSCHIHIYHTPGKRGGVGGCGHMSTHTVRSQTWSQRPKWGARLANGGWKSHLKTVMFVQISMKSLPIEKWVETPSTFHICKHLQLSIFKNVKHPKQICEILEMNIQ